MVTSLDSQPRLHSEEQNAITSGTLFTLPPAGHQLGFATSATLRRAECDNLGYTLYLTSRWSPAWIRNLSCGSTRHVHIQPLRRTWKSSTVMSMSASGCPPAPASRAHMQRAARTAGQRPGIALARTLRIPRAHRSDATPAVSGPQRAAPDCMASAAGGPAGRGMWGRWSGRASMDGHTRASVALQSARESIHGWPYKGIRCSPILEGEHPWMASIESIDRGQAYVERGRGPLHPPCRPALQCTHALGPTRPESVAPPPSCA